MSANEDKGGAHVPSLIDRLDTADVAEAQAVIQQMADEHNALQAAAQRLVTEKYRPWETSGGGEQCDHGYNIAIPCRRCDLALVFESRPRPGTAAEGRPLSPSSSTPPAPDLRSLLREARALFIVNGRSIHYDWVKWQSDEADADRLLELLARIDAALDEKQVGAAPHSTTTGNQK